MPREQIHFVTGKLAEFSLRETLAKLAPAVGFEYTIDVLNITVAALMTTDWVAKRITVPPGTTRLLLPGYCQGEMAVVEQLVKVPVERGPHDLRRLPEYFGCESADKADYGAYEIEIIAEINHAPKLRLSEVLSMAERFRANGADRIDVGCDPGGTWAGVGDVVKALVEAGHRVSIDSMNIVEIAAAAKAGATLALG